MGAYERASIRGFHVLQVVYLVTGVAVIWCTPRIPTTPSPAPLRGAPERTG